VPHADEMRRPKMEFTITNWRDGRGYFKDTARGEVDGERKYRKNLSRMKGDKR
jgi:hypothetical protein